MNEITMTREEAQQLYDYLAHQYIDPLTYPFVRSLIDKLYEFLLENK